MKSGEFFFGGGGGGGGGISISSVRSRGSSGAPLFDEISIMAV